VNVVGQFGFPDCTDAQCDPDIAVSPAADVKCVVVTAPAGRLIRGLPGVEVGFQRRGRRAGEGRHVGKRVEAFALAPEIERQLYAVILARLDVKPALYPDRAIVLPAI